MHNQEDIRGLLKETFESFEAEPDRDLWGSIREEIPPPRNPRWKYLALAAAIALLLMIGIRGVFTSSELPAIPESRELAQQQPPNEVLPNDPSVDTGAQLTPSEMVISSETTSQEIPDEPKTVEKVPQRSIDITISSPQPKTSSIPAVQELAEQTVVEPVQENTLQDISASSGSSPATSEFSIQRIESVQAEIDVYAFAEPTHNEVAQVPVPDVQKPRKKLRLNELTLDDVLLFASNTLNKTVTEPPLQAQRHKDATGDNVTRFQVKLGPLTITRTKHKKSASL